MKIKFNGTDVNPESSLDLVNDLVKNGIITNKDEQILGIYDTEVQLDGIYPSEELTSIMTVYPEWKIFTDPNETDAFNPEEGLPDVDKVGTVPDPNYQDSDDFSELENIELFPESETTFSEKSGEIDSNNNNTFSKTMSKRKNFDDPAVNEEGVAVVATQTEVEDQQNKDDANYTPAEEGFSSVDVAPFTDEEIDGANDVEVDSTDGEITVFSDEEIEEMIDPDEVEELADTMESEETAFAERKKRLFSAKRRLRKVNSKRMSRKSFAEELTDSEKSAVIEDIVAILEDAPEIKDAVVDEVEGIVSADAEDPEEVTETTEEVAEEPAVETTEETTVEEPVETEVTTEETVEEPVVEETVETTEEPASEEDDDDDISEFTEEEIEGTEESNDLDVEAFSEEEIEEAPDTQIEETTEEVVEEPTSEETTEEDEGEEIGRVFCKAFSEDSVKSYRMQQLTKMAESQNSRSHRR